MTSYLRAFLITSLSLVVGCEDNSTEPELGIVDGLVDSTWIDHRGIVTFRAVEPEKPCGATIVEIPADARVIRINPAGESKSAEPADVAVDQRVWAELIGVIFHTCPVQGSAAAVEIRS